MDVLIPNLGDIDEVEVIEITVSPGDQVQKNDSLIVIESDKASMEVPCPSDGVVEEILVTVGDMVGEGHPVAKISACLLYTSPSPRDGLLSRMPSSA